MIQEIPPASGTIGIPDDAGEPGSQDVLRKKIRRRLVDRIHKIDDADLLLRLARMLQVKTET
ncbi:MAG: hypothetical protein HQL33_07815 [Alphaproteobacteria bacterium]|nr:hypothetical protein [Alphaproteobacteria bacterium]